MENKTYMTVKEMTEKVNELLELLDRAKSLSQELLSANVRNEFALRYAPNRVDEVRPAPYDSFEKMIEEAKRYQKLFEILRGTLTMAESDILRQY